MGKKWYLSRTLWVAVAALVLDLLNGVYGVVDIPEGVRLRVVAALMIIMRLVTTRAVTIAGGK